VANIRLALAFAALMEMQLRGVAKRFHEPVGEDRLFNDGSFARQFFYLS